jgi:hypothetical protein
MWQRTTAVLTTCVVIARGVTVPQIPSPPLSSSDIAALVGAPWATCTGHAPDLFRRLSQHDNGRVEHTDQPKRHDEPVPASAIGWRNSPASPPFTGREHILLSKQPPEHASVLVGECDGRLRPSDAVSELKGPCRNRSLLLGGCAQRASCSDDHEPTQIGITSFGNATELLLAARRPLTRDQAEERTELAPIAELAQVPKACCKR